MALFDGAMYAYSIFNVIVINTPPFFVTAIPTTYSKNFSENNYTVPVNQIAYIGTFKIYELP